MIGSRPSSRSSACGRAWACASSRRPEACESRARSSSATIRGARSAASRCGFPSSRHQQNRQQRQQHEVASEHCPRGVRRVEREIPVADREPELCEQQREPEEPRGDEPAAAPDERHDRDQPDQELRQRGPCSARRRRRAKPRSSARALGRRRPAARREPDGEQGHDEQTVETVPARAAASRPGSASRGSTPS